LIRLNAPFAIHVLVARRGKGMETSSIWLDQLQRLGLALAIGFLVGMRVRAECARRGLQYKGLS
jgi:hypothetical protein